MRGWAEEVVVGAGDKYRISEDVNVCLGDVPDKVYKAGTVEAKDAEDKLRLEYLVNIGMAERQAIVKED